MVITPIEDTATQTDWARHETPDRRDIFRVILTCMMCRDVSELIMTIVSPDAAAAGSVFQNRARKQTELRAVVSIMARKIDKP